MPLRDHFRPPVSKQSSWEGFHGMWPALIVAHLEPHLPDDYTAEPRVHLGAQFEVDVCAFESDPADLPGHRLRLEGDSPETWTAPSPTSVAELEPVEQYAYEVLIFDHSRTRQLVAAIELVSPANKDRPDARQSFVAKCLTLLQQKVCVSIIDLVTTRNFNLYGQMLEMAGKPSDEYTATSPAIYAVTFRGLKVAERPRFEAWTHRLQVSEPLPTLPVWLNETLSVPLELEASYEDACRVLRIRD